MLEVTWTLNHGISNMTQKKRANILVDGETQDSNAFEKLKEEMLGKPVAEVPLEADVEHEEEAISDDADEHISDDQDVASESVEEPEADIEEEQKVKPVTSKKAEPLPDEVQQSIQRRINKIVAQKKQADDRVRELEAKLNSYQAPLPNIIPQIVESDWLVRPDTKQRVDMPKAADYADNLPQYFEDMRRYDALKQQVIHAVTSYERKNQGEQIKAGQLDAEYLPRVEEARTKYADFDKTINTADQKALEDAHPWVVNVLKESEYGPDIVYKMGKNPDYLRHLRSLPSHDLLKEIGKLEAMEEMSVKPRSVSAAPKPISSAGKLGGMASGSVKAKSFETMSLRELKDKLKPRRS